MTCASNPLLSGAGKTLVYEVGGNRFCRRIGRAHKSNHVYLVVDLQANSFHQKCHDPECAEWGSPSVPMPDDLSPFARPQGEVASASLSDSELMQMAQEMEDDWMLSEFVNGLEREMGGEASS